MINTDIRGSRPTIMSCKLSFVFVGILFLTVVEGSSHCMTDCNSFGQRSFTVYEGLCCSPSHKGDIIHVTKDNGRTGYVVCPDTIPKWCLEFKTCYDILQSDRDAPSGYYNITVNGSLVEVYCDMMGSNCDGEGGWTRVAFVNMSEPGASCPLGLEEYDNVTNGSLLCWINNPYDHYYYGCNSTFFPTYNVNYTKVCGRVRGYQYGYPYAFYCNLNNYNCFDPQIETYGVTLTYSSSPRKHIWTYAGGYYEQGTQSYDCPCNNGSQYQNRYIPFVGNDYYCESGRSVGEGGNILYANDPLWDGQDCPGLEATCCTSSKMPWFVKTLDETVSEDIELSTCGYNYYYLTYAKGTPLDLIELYIK